MKCDEVKEILLTDYIDGTIEGSAKRAVDEHLKECLDCGRLLSDVTESKKIFLEFKKLAPSDKVWSNIKEKLENQKENFFLQFLFGRSRFLKFASAFAVMLLIVSAIYITLSHETKKQEVLTLFLQNQIETYSMLSSGETDPLEYEYLYADSYENNE